MAFLSSHLNNIFLFVWCHMRNNVSIENQDYALTLWAMSSFNYELLNFPRRVRKTDFQYFDCCTPLTLSFLEAVYCNSVYMLLILGEEIPEGNKKWKQLKFLAIRGKCNFVRIHTSLYIRISILQRCAFTVNFKLGYIYFIELPFQGSVILWVEAVLYTARGWGFIRTTKSKRYCLPSGCLKHSHYI